MPTWASRVPDVVREQLVALKVPCPTRSQAKRIVKLHKAKKRSGTAVEQLATARLRLLAHQAEHGVAVEEESVGFFVCRFCHGWGPQSRTKAGLKTTSPFVLGRLGDKRPSQHMHDAPRRLIRSVLQSIIVLTGNKPRQTNLSF